VTAIARAAQGSLRDALSLLDQAIAYGSGEVRESAVRPMLGTVDREHVYRIADALVADDGPALLAEADALAARGLAFGAALDELASLFHRIAVAQVVPAAAQQFDDAQQVSGYAGKFTPESVQLAYQICAQGRSDLALAPDEATGFTMTLLRLLAFEPALPGASESAAASGGAPVPPQPRTLTRSSESNVAAMRSPAAAVAPSPQRAHADIAKADALPLPTDAAGWPPLVSRLKLTGMAGQLGAQTELKSVQGNVITLALPAAQKHLADKAYADKLKVALEAVTGRKLLLAFEMGDAPTASLAAHEKQVRAAAKAAGEQAFRDEPFVRDVLSRFDARIKTDTVEPLPNDGRDS
jgi:DNA polymerase III subunit gamma/tau